MGLILDSNTWRSYSSAYNSWIEFVSLHHFPEEPTESTFSNYIMFMCDHIKPSSVISYLSGITRFLEPYFPQIRDIRSSKLVRDTIIGCKRLRNVPTARKDALTTSMLEGVVNAPHDDYDDLLFLVLLLVGFHALLRLAELCDPDNRKVLNPAKRVKRSSVKLGNDTSFSFTLPAHKADTFFEGNLVLIHDLWSTLPIGKLFRDYLAQRDRRFPFLSPLWLTRHGEVPNRSFFINRLKKFGFGKSIAGQSMRAGGATALAELGASSDSIQSLGRWSSNAWLRYIRKHPTLVYHLERVRQRPTAPHHQSTS
ncbi:putative retroelement protein [Coprinopsis sp. MPI-PUGE-AT-0042]|nr:putative retroelement protein [Coprinopsis sp. MPI-PUGE-AT-0042]